ncbi:snRNA-activating protein complex subunit 2 isoform X2 [Brachyistius frenatus]|uniref:snRNA-activating protein complex subunit 2 isoform X2 n=1 Tax=Brachyistius frenatus TaxID=100188 RepID=UPI0037E7C895
MKPPPRTRNKPDRAMPAEPQRSGKAGCKWQRAEEKKLLDGLRRLGRNDGGLEDIDYLVLKKHVPTRSVSEIQSVVESLKDRVISGTSAKLQRRRCEEKRRRRPIEEWTQAASSLTGTREAAISGAFCQVLMVSSTEPRTLRNCDPPQVHRPPSGDPLVGRTVPFRPMPRLPVRGGPPNTEPARPFQLLRTPAPTMGPARRVPAPSRVVVAPNIGPPHPSATAGAPDASTSTCRPAATSYRPGGYPHTAAQSAVPAAGQVTPTCGSAADAAAPISTTSSTSFSPPTPALCSSASSLAPVPGAAPSSSTTSTSSTYPTPPLSGPAAAFHAKFGRTSKYATRDSPRTFGVKSVVNFERVYQFLGGILKPSEECQLTPMESAIVLDLLMSLPEELPLLDCNKLHKHLIQVYRRLSAPADSKMAKDLLKDLKDAETQSGRDRSPTGSQQNPAGTGNGGRNPQPHTADSQSGSPNTSSQPGEEGGLCPPLNPFMVPLELLKRR